MVRSEMGMGKRNGNKSKKKIQEFHPYLKGTCSKTLSGCLDPQKVMNLIFFSLFSQELSAFHLKEALYGFSMACRNCHHHYFCALGPLLSKIRLLEQKHCNIIRVNLITKMATN